VQFYWFRPVPLLRHCPPMVTSSPDAMKRFLKLLDAVEKRVKVESRRLGVTPEQLSMLKRIREVLSAKGLAATAEET